LLFVGTETGVYYSLNDGESWEKLKMNLPAVPVVDIKIKDNDLVIATNGRGFWIMDDFTPLRTKRAEVDAKSSHLYLITNHTRFGYNWWLDYVPGGDPGNKKNYFVQNMRPGLTYYELTFKQVNGERKRKFIDAGDPRPLGVIMYFKLTNEPKEISLAILDNNGREIRNYSKDEMMLNYGSGGEINTGLNKFVWDMRISRVSAVPKRPPTAVSPIVPPGKYKAKLTVDGVSETQDFEIFMSPKEKYTQAEADAKFAFWMELYNTAESSTQNVIKALKLKEEIAAKIESSKAAGADAGTIEDAEEQAEVIYALVDKYEGTYVSTGRTLAEVINLPATILFKMSFMSGILDHSEGPVTNNMKEVFKNLVEQSKSADAEYNSNIKVELAKLDEILK
jgi:hypothetical protein